MKQHKHSRTLQLASPLFLAAAIYACPAQAEVKLYGLMDAFVGSQKNPGAEHSNNVVNNGGMSTSYLGLGGSEDLGDGLKTVFAVEGFFRLDTGGLGRFDGDLPFARNAYLGLNSASVGQFTIGRNTTPYFLSTVIFNPLGDSYSFSPFVMHTYMPNFRQDGKAGISGITADSGWSNSVRYTTPDMDGFSGNLIYSLGEQGSNTSQDKWGGNVNYFNGGLGVTAAFQQVKRSGDAGFYSNGVSGYTKQDAAQFGLASDFEVVKLYGQYQYIKNHIEGGDTTSNGGELGVSVPVGKGSILASYAYSETEEEHDAFAKIKRNTWTLGYDYNLSKRTDVYVAYYNDDVTGLSNGYTTGVGIRTRY